MKIQKPGKPEKLLPPEKFICRYCECEFEAECPEYNREQLWMREFSGMSIIAKEKIKLTVICPHCGNVIQQFKDPYSKDQE